MNEQVLEKYKHLLQLRLNELPLLHLGEDTIRYDFFCALAEVEKLQPHKIQLEYAMHSDAYIPRNTEGSKRKEKPQIDLVVPSKKLNVEFALFRENSNEKGPIKTTENTVKMLNDMIRLALDSYQTHRDSYFVCVADYKMLGHKLKTKILGAFPSNYVITSSIIDQQSSTKSNKFDARFITKLRELNLNVQAVIKYEELLVADKVTNTTKVIVWEIKSIYMHGNSQ